jgi:hypothetical protein
MESCPSFDGEGFFVFKPKKVKGFGKQVPNRKTFGCPFSAFLWARQENGRENSKKIGGKNDLFCRFIKAKREGNMKIGEKATK